MQNRNPFFERLLLLPLFQGIGREEFWEIAERIRIGFQKLPGGAVIAGQDSSCEMLQFVLSGEVCVRQTSDDYAYMLSEYFAQPMVVQPEALFGMRTRYTRTFLASTATELLKIEKSAVRDILFYYPTFRINYLNMVSTQMQQATRLLWRSFPEKLHYRFVRFMAVRCLKPAGRKVLKIKMTQLAAELNATRLGVSNMLHDLQERGLLEIHRGHIVINSFERLMQYHL